MDLATVATEHSQEEKITIQVDNKSAIALMKNPVFHGRSKHIDTKYHFIRECVEREDIQVEFVSGEYQKADILTKALPKIRFLTMRQLIGLKELPSSKFVSSDDLEGKFSPICVLMSLEAFVELVNEETILTSEGCASIFAYINFGLVGDSYTEILNFCKSMIFSGCRFKAIGYVYHAEISHFSPHANLSSEVQMHYDKRKLLQRPLLGVLVLQRT
ncbi:hypothetical protein Tco_0872604 [Tanacetum coccineum]